MNRFRGEPGILMKHIVINQYGKCMRALFIDKVLLDRGAPQFTCGKDELRKTASRCDVWVVSQRQESNVLN